MVSSNSFVWTQSRPKKIEAGEWVWSYNHGTSQWELCQVTRTFRNDYDGVMVDVTIESVTGDTETITSTGDHPFWVVNRQGREGRPRVTYSDQDNDRPVGHWTQAKHLRLGDVFLLKNGKSATITSYRIRSERLQVYNLEVSTLRNFAVGVGGVLVHNICPKKKARNTPPGEKVQTPKTNPENFTKNKSGQLKNKNTGEIWEKSHTNHSQSEGGEFKVGLSKGKPPTKNNKITVASDGTVIKKDN